MRIALAAGILALALAAPARASDCGAPGAPCRVDGGDYLIALPDAPHPPAVVWLHGWGNSAEGAMANAALREPLVARGYALIAPDGLASEGTGGRRGWAVAPGRPWPRDDVAFLRAVIADAARRHGIDPGRVLLAGFSLGGSMVWTAACAAPDLARAYAPVSGAFWEPLPEGCAGPVNLLHVHGWADRTVPLEGRPLRGGQLVQGDVWQGLQILSETDGCTNRQPASASAEGPVWERHWTDCAGGRLDLLVHPGGHMVPAWWPDRALDWFEALPGVCPASGDREC